MDKNLELEACKSAFHKIADWIQTRKLTEKTCLTDQATGGFNLACDFLTHELHKLASLDNEKFLNSYKKDIE